MSSFVNKTSIANFNGNAADYVYDVIGRFVNVYDENSVTHSYTYDGDNLRQSKTVNGETTSFILDGMDVAIESGSQNTITYLRGNGLEGYLKNGANRKYYYNEPIHGHIC